MLNVERVKEVNGSGVFSLGVKTDLEAVAREIRLVAHKMRTALNVFLMGAKFAEQSVDGGEAMAALIKAKVEQFTSLSIRLDETAGSLSRHQDQ